MSRPTYDFTGQVAFITGAARGMGRSHAIAYAEHGADIVAVDICENRPDVPIELGTRDQLNETVERVEATGSDALALEADVTDETAVTSAVERATDRFGRIDILANNAGIGDFETLCDLPETRWDAVLDINLKGVWLPSKHVGTHLAARGDGGAIISTASTTGLVGQYGMGHYAASKHGVVGLTKSLALELAEHDVTVNCVCPTGTDTPGVAATDDVFGDEYITRAEELAGSWNLLDDGMLAPEDVSDAYLWLASEASRYVTGIALPVDAGFTAK